MIYNDDSSTKKGRLLGRGKGMDNMMAKSFINKWSDENTILEVKNPNDLIHLGVFTKELKNSIIHQVV